MKVIQTQTDNKVIVDAKYEKVEIHDNGIAMVTNITGKTQTINLK